MFGWDSIGKRNVVSLVCTREKNKEVRFSDPSSQNVKLAAEFEAEFEVVETRGFICTVLRTDLPTERPLPPLMAVAAVPEVLVEGRGPSLRLLAVLDWLRLRSA
mmetsp:Transcript_41018/g.88119  ORF Transcript_41018/g.88119 Transcript_41018/m.88119 type:complete len:104 (-) Transcript_41018:140-451(-)